MEQLNGRKMILTTEKEINSGNVVAVLNQALLVHWVNREQIIYLWKYYRGNQPILNRVKEVRPEICNHIVENRIFLVNHFNMFLRVLRVMILKN